VCNPVPDDRLDHRGRVIDRQRVERTEHGVVNWLTLSLCLGGQRGDNDGRGMARALLVVFCAIACRIVPLGPKSDSELSAALRHRRYSRPPLSGESRGPRSGATL